MPCVTKQGKAGPQLVDADVIFHLISSVSKCLQFGKIPTSPGKRGLKKALLV